MVRKKERQKAARVLKNDALPESTVAVSLPESTQRAQRISLRSVLKLTGVFVFVNISWLIFRSPSLREVTLYVHSLKNVMLPFRTVHAFVLIPLAAAFLLQMPNEEVRRKSFNLYVRLPVPVKAAAAVCFFIGLNVISTSGIAPFIYFGF